MNATAKVAGNNAEEPAKPKLSFFKERDVAVRICELLSQSFTDHQSTSGVTCPPASALFHKFQKLPTELKAVIYSHLTPGAQYHLGFTSQHHQEIMQHQLWRKTLWFALPYQFPGEMSPSNLSFCMRVVQLSIGLQLRHEDLWNILATNFPSLKRVLYGPVISKPVFTERCWQRLGRHAAKLGVEVWVILEDGGWDTWTFYKVDFVNERLQLGANTADDWDSVDVGARPSLTWWGNCLLPGVAKTKIYPLSVQDTTGLVECFAIDSDDDWE